MKKEKGKIVLVIAGPTGVGESTVTKEIIKKYPIFRRLVTATTRKPRLKEKNKIDYYFFSKEKFLKELDDGNIIEHTYIKSRDVYYGSYKRDLEQKSKEGFNIIVNPDIIGTKYYKEKYNALTIFLVPESIDSLKDRILKRDKNISEEELKKRLNYAKQEMREEASFYDNIVLNETGKLDSAINEISSLIEKAGYIRDNN